MNSLPIKDMANTYIEHSMVINNFVTTIGNQLKSSLCRVFGDSVKYKWAENDNKPVIPDVSINCDIKNRRSTNFLGVPRFIMEVLSDATEQYDRNEKMELYKKVEVAEYWIVDWRKNRWKFMYCLLMKIRLMMQSINWLQQLQNRIRMI